MTELPDSRPLSRVELIVLARLSAAKGATESEIAASLRKLGSSLADAALADCVTAAIASLRGQLLCAGPPENAAPPAATEATKSRKRSARKPAPPKPPRFTLTDAGRLALRQTFGLTTTPSWMDMCNRIVPALALDEQPESAAADTALRSVDAMMATLLRRDRSLGETANVAQLCDMIIARALGMPSGPVTLAGIRAYALAMHCGIGSKAELEEIAARFVPVRTAKTSAARSERELKALAARLADQQLGVERGTGSPAKASPKAMTKSSLVQSLQRRWVGQLDEADDARRSSALRSAPVQPPSSPPAPATEPGEALLVAVRQAMPMVGSDGRYGKENVFVSALWRQIAQHQRELSLDGFKRWLVAANRNQLLALARADLVDDMDARLVEDSEIEYLGATFHFVLDRRDPSAAPGQVHHGR